MKEKTCFSTILLFHFFPARGEYTLPIDLSCYQKFEKHSLTQSGNIGAQSWKI